MIGRLLNWLGVMDALEEPLDFDEEEEQMEFYGPVSRDWVRGVCVELGFDPNKVKSVMITPSEVIVDLGMNNKYVLVVVEDAA